eukprot:g54819.t1
MTRNMLKFQGRSGNLKDDSRNASRCKRAQVLADCWKSGIPGASIMNPLCAQPSPFVDHKQKSSSNDASTVHPCHARQNRGEISSGLQLDI